LFATNRSCHLPSILYYESSIRRSSLCAICYIYTSEEFGIGFVEQETSLVPVEMIDPVASSPEAQHFREALQDGDMHVVRDMLNGSNDELQKYYGKYLASLEGSRLIELINDRVYSIQGCMLQTILVHADQSLIDKVFGALRPPNSLLRSVAKSADLACIPERFTYLLGKIDDQGEQESAVRCGVSALVDKNKTECLDPLLTTLREETFLSKDLENNAIYMAFSISSIYSVDKPFFAKHFFDHPVISAKDYSDALYSSYYHGGQDKELFHWLLARADSQDLETAQKNEYFSEQEPEFRQAVNQALEAVGPNTRPGITQRGITTTVTALEKLDIPTDLILLTLEYSEWQTFDPDMRLGLNHREVVKVVREALKDYIPDDPFNIIAEYI
jgi:hypothetical protein